MSPRQTGHLTCISANQWAQKGAWWHGTNAKSSHATIRHISQQCGWGSAVAAGTAESLSEVLDACVSLLEELSSSWPGFTCSASVCAPMARLTACYNYAWCITCSNMVSTTVYRRMPLKRSCVLLQSLVACYYTHCCKSLGFTDLLTLCLNICVSVS